MNWRALVGYGLMALAVMAIAVAISGKLEDTYGSAAMYVVLLLWCVAAVGCFALALVRGLVEAHEEELAIASTVTAAALFVLTVLVPIAVIGAATGLVDEKKENVKIELSSN